MSKSAPVLGGTLAPLACAVVSALLSIMFACSSLEVGADARMALVLISGLLANWCLAMAIERQVAPLFARLRVRRLAAR